MTRIVKWQLMLLAFLLASALFGKQTKAATINAATCSQTDVSKALSQAKDGDSVLIPAGTCHWTSTISVTPTGSLTILGAGNQSVVGGGDQTVIVDDVSHTPIDYPSLSITTVAGKSFRLSGITFQGGNGGQGFNGTVGVGGYSQQVRVDHVHFRLLNDTAISFSGWEYGVIDHCLIDALAANNNGIRVQHNSWNNDTLGQGDAAWADLSYFGSNKAIYAEDNIFNGGASDDAEAGAHLVFRHNTLNHTFFQVHGTQNSRRRGARAYEVYGNTFIALDTDPQSNQAAYVRSGAFLFWGNTVGTYKHMIDAHNDRSENQFIFGTWASAGASNGYCGLLFGQTTLDTWDGNNDSAGYPCLDQIGRGKGDLLVGNPIPINSIKSTSGTVAWPHQALEPVYEWLDAYTGLPSNSQNAIWATDSGPYVQNRDYYLGTTLSGQVSQPIAFDGTSGVGSGLLAARPTSCTPLTAYWATDKNTLYQCATADSWTPYYSPYTYPHPLTSTLSSGTAPNPPKLLTATVE